MLYRVSPLLTDRVKSDDDRIVLLTLIGMLRTGEHVISAEYRRWFDNKPLIWSIPMRILLG